MNPILSVIFLDMYDPDHVDMLLDELSFREQVIADMFINGNREPQFQTMYEAVMSRFTAWAESCGLDHDHKPMVDKRIRSCWHWSPEVEDTTVGLVFYTLFDGNYRVWWGCGKPEPKVEIIPPRVDENLMWTPGGNDVA